MINVLAETPCQAEVAALLAQSDALAAILYPGEVRRALNPGTLDVPGTHVFVARVTGEAAGCCALIESGSDWGELKRMIVDPRFRGRGVGAALLAAVEAKARALGLGSIQMEVGVRNLDGEALYRRHGYELSTAFGRYEPTPISRFFRKRLDQVRKVASD